ncbi:uncharacterized protein LOC113320080 [Papaver somniferum]|uniref:uncharacterized protein LOC113320080 n=1 Tax=Papaver somniferum TaxID=3469 RepID=UPI000E6F6BDE|nr:uncharacterized protein LOC113320080 [Papaver somniferum]
MGRKKTKKKAAGDEQICRRRFGKWKCKNASSDNKLRFCEKHYKDYKVFEDFCRNRSKLPTKKKRSGDGEGEGCSATGVKTRVSKSRKKITDQSLDETGGIQPPTTDMECGSANVGTKKLHPDEQYCCQTGKGWRCKNFRMSHGADASVPKTNYCEKHYNYYAEYEKNLKKKKRSGGGGGADAGCSTATGPVEIRRSKRRKTATEEDETGEIQPATSDDTSNTIIEDGGSPKIGEKRKTVEKMERTGDLKSLTKIGEPVVVLESLEHYKSKCFELTLELEKQKMELEKKNVELEKQKLELEKKNAELETKKTAAEDENAVKYWRNKCSDLESLVLKMEAEIQPCVVKCLAFLIWTA